MYRLLLPLLCLLSAASRASTSANTYTFDYNASCASAYRAYLSLHVTEGDALIRRELMANPYNLTATYIADYGDAVTLLFNGDPQELAQRAAHEGERLARIERGSEEDPWKRLALAGIHLHWSLIKLREGRQLQAATGLRRSYILLKENAARFPRFAADDALLGAEEALAGIIPESYKWLANMLGMKGSLAAGMERLAACARQAPGSPLYEEGLLYDAFIRFTWGGAKEGVWQQIGSDAAFPVSGNPMRAFFRANLAISYRKADAAISALSTPEMLAAARTWPILNFELGSALLLRSDAASLPYLGRFLSTTKGSNFIKDALQQSAFAAYLAGDRPRAEAFRARMLREGAAQTDADRQALRFAKAEVWPHPALLSARLLVDGGYATQALAKLRGISSATLTSAADRLEYDFRTARALEETGNAAAAVQAYSRVVASGKDRPEHFAARSALQMAGIYEARGQKEAARRYYEIALSMRDHDYQTSIDQMAKAGLARN